MHETVNSGNNNPITIKELIEKIEKSLNRKANLVDQPIQSGDVDITYSSIKDLPVCLIFLLKPSIAEGFGEYIEQYIFDFWAQ